MLLGVGGWGDAPVQPLIVFVSFYVALNTSSKTAIKTRTHLMGFAVFGGASLVNQSQARGSFAALSQPDMLSAYGIRSASSQDPRYTNGNYVKPYSNWRGPIWVNTNLMIACEQHHPHTHPR